MEFKSKLVLYLCYCDSLLSICFRSKRKKKYINVLFIYCANARVKYTFSFVNELLLLLNYQ